MMLFDNLVALVGDLVRYLLRFAFLLFAGLIIYGIAMIVFAAAFNVRLPNPFDMPSYLLRLVFS